MTATKYQLSKLGHLLKTGDARIVGKVSLGQRWPDEPHAWIIEDLTNQTTHHVPVNARPTWARYGATCPSCGRDNSANGNVCTADDCPGNGP